jgi:hypothetical protein
MENKFFFTRSRNVDAGSQKSLLGELDGEPEHVASSYHFPATSVRHAAPIHGAVDSEKIGDTIKKKLLNIFMQITFNAIVTLLPARKKNSLLFSHPQKVN